MSLLPPNGTPLERAISDAVRPDLPVELGRLWNPWRCPEHLLPYLAWALHLGETEGWALAVSTDQQRALIARSIALHRRKGTPWSIREAMKMGGFNDLELHERLPVARYDAAIAYTGADTYSAYGWAQFRAVADVGDSQGISGAQTRRIIDIIEEFKPQRSHLVGLQYRASTSDQVASADRPLTAGQLTADDTLAWGRYRYDGSVRHDQGTLHHHDGALRHDGTANHRGYSAAGIRYDSAREDARASGTLTISDRQSRGPLYDAGARYDSHLDHGHSAPVAEDLPLAMLAAHVATDRIASADDAVASAAVQQADAYPWGRHRHDGALAYDQGRAARYDGTAAHDASLAYAGSIASGARYDAEIERCPIAGSIAWADRQSRGPLYDAGARYDGHLDHGHSAPVAEDLPMPITITRLRRYNGRRPFAAHRTYDGAQRFAGAEHYLGAATYAGDTHYQTEAA
nr:phage tail protein I [Stutzerimonas stutzeri]